MDGKSDVTPELRAKLAAREAAPREAADGLGRGGGLSEAELARELAHAAALGFGLAFGGRRADPLQARMEALGLAVVPGGRRP